MTVGVECAGSKVARHTLTSAEVRDMAIAAPDKTETKAANLRLHDDTWSLLHYLSALEERSKADIVEEALRDYAATHQDRVADYIVEIARVAGLPAPKSVGVRTSASTAADALARIRATAEERKTKQPKGAHS